MPWTLLMRSDRTEGHISIRQPPPAALSQVRDVLATGALYVAVVLGFCHGLARAGMFSLVGQLYIHKQDIDAAHAVYFSSTAGILGWSWARSMSLRRTLPIVAGSAN